MFVDSYTVKGNLYSQCVYVRERVRSPMHLLWCSRLLSSLEAGYSSCCMNERVCVYMCVKASGKDRACMSSRHTSWRAATITLYTHSYRSISIVTQYHVLIFTSSSRHLVCEPCWSLHFMKIPAVSDGRKLRKALSHVSPIQGYRLDSFSPKSY